MKKIIAGCTLVLSLTSSAIIGFNPGKVVLNNVLIEGGNQIKKLDATYSRLGPAVPVFPVAAGIYIRFTASTAITNKVSIKDLVLRSANSCPLTGPGGVRVVILDRVLRSWVLVSR